MVDSGALEGMCAFIVKFWGRRSWKLKIFTNFAGADRLAETRSRVKRVGRQT